MESHEPAAADDKGSHDHLGGTPGIGLLLPARGAGGDSPWDSSQRARLCREVMPHAGELGKEQLAVLAELAKHYLGNEPRLAPVKQLADVRRLDEGTRFSLEFWQV